MLAPLVVRMKALLFRRSSDAELDEELRYHIDRDVERRVAGGMTPQAAQEAARRAFGNVSVTTDQARDASRWRLVEELRQDVAYALRTCRRAPAFVGTVVGTIGLGLGLLTAAFTLFDAYVLRPIAVRDPRALYDITWHSRNGDWHRLTWQQYQSLRRGGILRESFAYVNLVARILGRPAIGQLVDGNYFQALGIRAVLGRTLEPEDTESPGGAPVVVLSHDTWESFFGSDSTILGRRIAVNGVRLTVIGVAPKSFGGLESVPMQYWAPITMLAALDSTRDVFPPKVVEALRVVGRLRAEMRVEQTTSALLGWLRSSTSDLPRPQRAGDVMLTSRATSIPLTPDVIAAFMPIAVAFVLVMLTACANVANVMLARGMARQREIGIRLALGAGRARLIRQLLTESVLLSVPAAFTGYIISRLTIDLGVYAMYATVPAAYRAYVRPMPLTADIRVAVFMMTAAVLSAVAFGLAPAVRTTRPSVVQATRGDFESNLRPSRMRSGLVVAQIVVSVLLLICAGILLGDARTAQTRPPGIRIQNIVQLELFEHDRLRAIDAVRRAADVRQVASAASAPLDGIFKDLYAGRAGAAVQRIKYNIVSPEYFTAIEVPVLRGRVFSPDEARAKAAVAVVSEATARSLWPGRDPIGEHLLLSNEMLDTHRLARYHNATVIGVVGNVAAGWIGLPLDLPVVYYPQPVEAPASTILLRTASDAERGRAAIESLLATLDSAAMREAHTGEASLALQLYPFSIACWIASLIGGVALLLTVTGVYGVLSYVVVQRTREFGVRTALGASPAMLIALVLRQLARLAVVGVVVGGVLALGVSRVFASIMVENGLSIIDTYNPLGYAIGIATVLGACLLAAYVPSRRASAVDPAEALRADS